MKRRRMIALLTAILMICSSVLPNAAIAAESLAEESYEYDEIQEANYISQETDDPVIIEESPSPEIFYDEEEKTYEMTEETAEGEQETISETDMPADMDDNSYTTESMPSENDTSENSPFQVNGTDEGTPAEEIKEQDSVENETGSAQAPALFAKTTAPEGAELVMQVEGIADDGLHADIEVLKEEQYRNYLLDIGS